MKRKNQKMQQQQTLKQSKSIQKGTHSKKLRRNKSIITYLSLKRGSEDGFGMEGVALGCEESIALKGVKCCCCGEF